MSNSLQTYGPQPSRLLCSWDFSRQEYWSEFSRQEYWSHALLKAIFLTQGSNLCFLALPALAGRFFTTSTTWEGWIKVYRIVQTWTYQIFIEKRTIWKSNLGWVVWGMTSIGWELGSQDPSGVLIGWPDVLLAWAGPTWCLPAVITNNY